MINPKPGTPDLKLCPCLPRYLEKMTKTTPTEPALRRTLMTHGQQFDWRMNCSDPVIHNDALSGKIPFTDNIFMPIQQPSDALINFLLCAIGSLINFF